MTRVVWVNKWFDPPHETNAARSLLDGGADILFQNTDSSTVLRAAARPASIATASARNVTS